MKSLVLHLGAHLHFLRTQISQQLQPETSNEVPSILPQMKHACDDERVRGHFMRVEWFETPNVVHRGGRPNQTMWESDGPEYLAGVRRILGEPRFAAGRSLLVFEDAWPMDESAWSALAASTSALIDGSKVLLTCRDADLAQLGTAEPVVLHTLRQEEY